MSADARTRKRRLVVLKLNNLGDNVLFVPAFQEIRRRHPDWLVTLVTTPREAELYRGEFAPDEVLTSEKAAFNKSHRAPWVLASWIWRIRRRRADACFLAYDSGSAAHLVARWSGARAIIGGNIEGLRITAPLSADVPLPENRRLATWNWRMAEALDRAMGGKGPWPEEPPMPDLSHLSPAGGRPNAGRRRVVIHPGASKYLNQWPADRFSAVASGLARDFEVVWLIHGAAAPAPEGCIAAPVDSLGELSRQLVSADLFLGNNSGPMHLANALGCSGVVVTGPSAHGWDPFWNRERWTVLRHPDLSCAPCETPNRPILGCANTASPMACLKYWAAGAVERACRERLGGAVLTA
jgi:ADP-heptose:LPS heptosyltransferase